MSHSSHAIYPAPHHEGYNPYLESSGDRWLYEESMGSSELWFALVCLETARSKQREAIETGGSLVVTQDVLDSLQKAVNERSQQAQATFGYRP